MIIHKKTNEFGGEYRSSFFSYIYLNRNES